MLVDSDELRRATRAHASDSAVCARDLVDWFVRYLT